MHGNCHINIRARISEGLLLNCREEIPMSSVRFFMFFSARFELRAVASNELQLKAALLAEFGQCAGLYLGALVRNLAFSASDIVDLFLLGVVV